MKELKPHEILVDGILLYGLYEKDILKKEYKSEYRYDLDDVNEELEKINAKILEITQCQTTTEQNEYFDALAEKQKNIFSASLNKNIEEKDLLNQRLDFISRWQPEDPTMHQYQDDYRQILIDAIQTAQSISNSYIKLMSEFNQDKYIKDYQANLQHGLSYLNNKKRIIENEIESAESFAEAIKNEIEKLKPKKNAK